MLKTYLNKTALTAFMLIAFLMAYYMGTVAPEPVKTSRAMPKNAAYKLSFDDESEDFGSRFLYFPSYYEAGPDTAAYFAKSFNFLGEMAEGEDFYSFLKEDYKLTVFKHISCVKLERTAEALPAEEEITTSEALEIARGYLAQFSLDVNFEETICHQENDGFFVDFVESLDGIKNMSFVSTVFLDPWGGLVSLEYYYMDYEKLNTFPLKTVKEALGELPENPADGFEIELKECRLVYIYDDSLVQPAYFIKGTMNKGEPFEVYVKAAKF